MKNNPKQIYHPWHKWEDHKNGFYFNMSGVERENRIHDVVNMFMHDEKTREFMLRVINEWKFSCEHNLTNPAINKVAYIGQSAACLYCGAPNTVTMEAWSLVPKEHQEKANEIAKECIEIWKANNKKIQLCLNLD